MSSLSLRRYENRETLHGSIDSAINEESSYNSLSLTVLSYFVAVFSLCLGAGGLCLNVFVFSEYYDKESASSPNDYKCFNELGKYKLFWNLSVAIPILYIAMAAILLTALIKKSNKMLNVWVVLWFPLICLYLGVQAGFNIYHCSPMQACMLTIAFVILSIIEVLMGMVVAAGVWRRMGGSSTMARISEYMEQIAGKSWRSMLGLKVDDDARQGVDQARKSRKPSGSEPGGEMPFPARRPRPPGTQEPWTVKRLNLETGEVIILQR